MKQRQQFILVISALAFTILACQVGNIGLGQTETVQGSGNVVEESRAVSDFTGVNLATIGNLAIEIGNSESLTIEAEDNLMEYFETEVRNGTLFIETRPNVRLDTTQPVNYYLTVTELDTLQISSAGDIQAPELEAKDFTIAISSAGDLDIASLVADTLEIDITSAGDLDIAGGKVTTQDINITSNGSYTAGDLASNEADVRLGSTGSATIRVSDYLKANLSSTGSVHYFGNPTVDATTSSVGTVTQAGE